MYLGGLGHAQERRTREQPHRPIRTFVPSRNVNANLPIGSESSNGSASLTSPYLDAPTPFVADNAGHVSIEPAITRRDECLLVLF